MRFKKMVSLLRCSQPGFPWLSDVSSIIYSDASLAHLQDLLKDEDRNFLGTEFSAWSYFWKTDCSTLLRRLQSLSRKFDPIAPTSSSVAPSPDSSRKVSKKDGSSSKQGRDGSESSAPDTSSSQAAPRAADTLGLFGIESFKAPSGNFLKKN